jgi:inhibitor of KinA
MTGSLYDSARFRVCGDRAMLVEYGDGVALAINERVRAMALIITREKLQGVESVIPAYRSLAITYNPLIIAPEVLQRRLIELEEQAQEERIPPPRTVEIPVLYGDEVGPDLGFVAQHNGLTLEAVVQIHSGTLYPIYAVGFAPGFCYLGGLDERLHTPRLATPRKRVAAGSVGIAETQTGVYPSDSPGGWQLIGRTPLNLFNPAKDDPFLYRAGDRIRFVPIDAEAFSRIRAIQEAS